MHAVTSKRCRRSPSRNTRSRMVEAKRVDVARTVASSRAGRPSTRAEVGARARAARAPRAQQEIQGDRIQAQRARSRVRRSGRCVRISQIANRPPPSGRCFPVAVAHAADLAAGQQRAVAQDAESPARRFAFQSAPRPARPATAAGTNFTCGSRSAPSGPCVASIAASTLLEHHHAGHDRAAGEVSRQAGMVVGIEELHCAKAPVGANYDRRDARSQLRSARHVAPERRAQRATCAAGNPTDCGSAPGNAAGGRRIRPGTIRPSGRVERGRDHDHCAWLIVTGGAMPSLASSPLGTASSASNRLNSASAPSSTAHAAVSLRV